VGVIKDMTLIYTLRYEATNCPIRNVHNFGIG
jgi:hypothetical protein